MLQWHAAARGGSAHRRASWQQDLWHPVGAVAGVYDIEYLFTVDEHVFNPPPKVKSGVIRLTRNDVTDLGVDERMFKRLVKLSFGQRRKMLRSSLKPAFMADPSVLDRDVFRQRPEQLGVEDFIALTRLAMDQPPQSVP